MRRLRCNGVGSTRRWSGRFLLRLSSRSTCALEGWFSNRGFLWEIPPGRNLFGCLWMWTVILRRS